MAGQRKNPTTGAVTVLKPTNRQTPKRAGGAAVTKPLKVWNACWEWEPGSRKTSLRGVVSKPFFNELRQGLPRQWEASKPARPASITSRHGGTGQASASIALALALRG